MNAYRRKFLAANHNAEEGIIFVPTNFVTYLRPNGLRLSSIFPFITLPARPPAALGGVLFDRRYRTASITASTPLLFALSCWGMITAFRPRPVGKVALTRLLLLAAGSAGAALLLWGYIAPRYLGDFVPFLVLASAVAMADIWRRLDGRSRRLRLGSLAVLTVAALFSIVANFGIAVTPNEEWIGNQALHYVEAQKAVADLTGQSLRSRVVRGNSLPAWGPADQLYVVGNCDGLYVSNGEDYSTVPSQQFSRTTWLAVERGHAFMHSFRLTVGPVTDGTETLSLVRAGNSTVVISASKTQNAGWVELTYSVESPGQNQAGTSFEVPANSTHAVQVITDPAKHLFEATTDGAIGLEKVAYVDRPIVSEAAPGHSEGVPPALTAVDTTNSLPSPTLCLDLIGR